MKPVDVRTARASAERKGFVKTQGDHEYYYLYIGGRKTAWRIKISHGAPEMKPSHIRADAKACQMMVADDMRKILACDHDRQWVEQHYHDKNPE